MKCLPASKVSSSRGRVLHDWHAEVLCMRAFNVFLLEECKAVASGSGTSRYVRRRAVPSVQGDPHSADGETTTQPWCGQPFEWNDDISLHMYTSDAPCEQQRRSHRQPRPESPANK